MEEKVILQNKEILKARVLLTLYFEDRSLNSYELSKAYFQFWNEGIDEETITRILKELEANGYLEKKNVIQGYCYWLSNKAKDLINKIW
jgi:DNA-binding PadR family transcriptional regulator